MDQALRLTTGAYRERLQHMSGTLPEGNVHAEKQERLPHDNQENRVSDDQLSPSFPAKSQDTGDEPGSTNITIPVTIPVAMQAGMQYLLENLHIFLSRMGLFRGMLTREQRKHHLKGRTPTDSERMNK